MTLLQIRCEHLDGVGGNQEPLGLVFRNLVLTKWRACELLWCKRCRPYTVCYCIVGLCKHFFNVIKIETEKFKLATVQMLFKFFIMVEWN